MIASIQKVISVEPIEGADKIEMIKVLGWELVSKKGNFQPGDYCVYIEIDSKVPEIPAFEFLRPKNFLVKTVRMKGQISQGLAMPLEILPKGIYGCGEDVSKLLGIEHYEKPIPLEMAGFIRKVGLPFNIPITDEPMIQSVPEMIKELTGKMVYISTKCDGTSGTFALCNGEYHACSRNNSWQNIENNIFWLLSKKYKIEEKMREYGKNICLQGEVCGPGIQKNKLGLKEHDVLMFNFFDIDKYRYFNYYELTEIVKLFGLKMVPVESVCEFKFDLPDLLKMSKGLYSNTNNRKEGIVIRPVEEEISKFYKKRLSIKVLNNDFLLKDE